MCWECSPSAAPHAVPAAIPLVLWYTEAHSVPKCSSVVQFQVRDAPLQLGRYLGESRDYDLESFLTELMGAHINAVVFNRD